MNLQLILTRMKFANKLRKREENGCEVTRAMKRSRTSIGIGDAISLFSILFWRTPGRIRGNVSCALFLIGPAIYRRRVKFA